MSIGVFLFAAVVVLFIALAAYARWWHVHGGGKVQREKEAERKRVREAGAARKGWTYDATIDGNIHYRLSGRTPAGMAWTVHYDSDHSSSSSTPKLVFLAPLATEDHAWYLHDAKTFGVMQGAGARAVVSGLGKLVGAFSESVRAKRDFFLEAQSLPVGSAAFRARYVLAAIDPRWAGVIDADVERLILDWPDFKQSMTLRDNCLSAELSPQGIKVQLYADAPDFEVIEQLVDLGQRVADASNRLRAGRGFGGFDAARATGA